jgi:mono/diheme cytochrome c family protein
MQTLQRRVRPAGLTLKRNRAEEMQEPTQRAKGEAMNRRFLIVVAAASGSASILGAHLSAGTLAEEPGDWKAPASAVDRKNPVAASAQARTAGKGIFDRECASCHGDRGKGDGKKGRDLDLSPADLSAPDVASQTDGALFWKITTGRKPMPSFQKTLSDEQRWQVVHYIRSLESGAGKEAKG